MPKSPVPLEEFEPSATEVSEAVTLPPKAYTDDEFFQFELEAVWNHSWMCVGRVDEVPNPGDYYTTTLAGGEPVIVVRNAKGEIHVMSSVCQHRGMCITAPAKRTRADWMDPPPECSGTTRTFRCPYHWWTYDLDGKLIGAPDMHHRSGFVRSEITLPQLATEVWNGFIFANYDHAAPALAPQVAKISKLVEHHHLEDLKSTPRDILAEVPFNWKIMIENFMEGYHNDRLHHDLYDLSRGDDPGDEVLVEGHMSFDFEPGECGIGGWARTAFKDRGLNPTQRALFPPIDTLTDDDRWHMVYFSVLPSLIVGVSSDSAFWFVVTPTGPSSHTLSMSYLVPQSTKDLKLFDNLFAQHVSGVELFNNEDLPANHATQIGLRSRYAPRGPLAKGDLFLAQFSKWLLEQYRASDSPA